MSYSVVIAEDQRMPRLLLEHIVAKNDDFTLAASFEKAEQAAKYFEHGSADLAVMDVHTRSKLNGLAASKIIKNLRPKTKIIIITGLPEPTWLKKARSIGIESFWYKESEEEILNVMRRTMAGERIYPDDTPIVPMGRITNHDFTERELEVIALLPYGDSNEEIGDKLGITGETVKFRLKGILRKTGFHTRTELATAAIVAGIVVKG